MADPRNIFPFDTRFRPIRPPTAGVFDEPRLQLCINRDWIPHLDGLLERLLWADAWEGTDDEKETAIAEVHKLLGALGAARECDDRDNPPPTSGCIEHDTASSIITYAPSDPFATPDYIPPGYIAVPFLIVHEGDPLNILGFHVGDVITGYLSAPVPTPATAGSVAQIRVRFSGKGVVELHLIKIPGGGMALITHDNNPFTAQTVVLNKDLVQLPPETNSEAIIEIPFETDGEHTIDISFVPRINDELTFITYGGGLRSVVLCGFDKTLDQEVENRQHKGRVEVQESAGMGIRTDPDRCYMLQFECSPGEWVDLLDTRCGAVAQGAQPTNGTPLLEGECREWDVVLRANEQWLLPLAVSEGDTIQTSAGQGVWHDGGIIWYCLQGFTYAFGACVSSAGPHTGDPIEALDHMRLVMSVDGAFTDGYNTVYAVPSGTTDGVVFFQANDSVLNDNSGSVSFHVKVCKQSVPATPIDITYAIGVGLTQVFPGQYITALSTCCGGGGAHDWAVEVTFSQDVRLTVVSATGFSVSPCVGSGIYETIWSGGIGGVHVSDLSCLDSTNPTDIAPGVGNAYTVETGSVDAEFSITFLVELP